MTHHEWEGAIVMWLLTLRAAGRPQTTLNLRRYQLQRLARELAPLSPWDVTGEHLVMWLGSHAGWTSRDTLRSNRSAVRGFFGWALDSGRISRDPSRALRPIKPSDPNPKPTPEDAYRRALASADDRERLMLRMAGELGMRRGEVAVAHSDDLAYLAGGWVITVHGKGSKIRRLPIDAGLAAQIRIACREAGGGYLFPGRVDGHLSAAWVGKLIARLLPDAWAMHSLRHRFGTGAYEVERDIEVVRELLGHASLNTTRLYVKVPAERLRRTVEAVARR